MDQVFSPSIYLALINRTPSLRQCVTALAILLAGVPLAVAQVGNGYRGPRYNDRALAKLLTNPKPTVHQRGLAFVAADPKRRIEKIDLLIEAADENLADVDDRGVTTLDVSLIELIASTRGSAADEFLLRHARGPSAPVAMLVADAIGKHAGAQRTETLEELTERPEFDDSYGFRFTVTRALWNAGDEASLRLLLKLRRSIDGQLAIDIDRLLATLDPATFDVEAIKRQLASSDLPDGMKPIDFESGDVQSASYQSSGGPMIEFDRPRYYGIPIEAKRMLFILDHSGSMKEPMVGGGDRLGRAKQELMSVISGLPSDAEFAILSFSDEVKLWRSELSLATAENRKLAIAHVQSILFGDKTNTHAALARSFEFNDSLEAVYVLSDGRPTIGAVTNPSVILRGVLNANRFRHLRFHTIGFALDSQTRTFLKALAEQTGGEFRPVE